MPSQLLSPNVPDGLWDILLLAGLVIFSITVLAAILSSLFVKQENLFYLGTQMILLSLFLELSARWAYPLWLTGVFANAGQMRAAASTLLLLSIAYTIDVGLRVAVWDGILRRQGQRAVPPLLIGATRAFIYLIVGLTILQFVYDQQITALAALSGAFALVVGLSAQSTLGEMFAGIAIALSRPLRVGDWVKIGSLEEGRVSDMTWRMVRIETHDGIIVNVPNRTVADQAIQNFTYPRHTIRLSQAIYFPTDSDPSTVQDLAAAAIATAPGVVTDPAPSVLYCGAKSGVAEYSMRYYIDDYSERDAVTENVWKHVVEYISRSPVKIAYPRQFISIDAITGEEGKKSPDV
jgi:small-conductance mechanosensitive channel